MPLRNPAAEPQLRNDVRQDMTAPIPRSTETYMITEGFHHPATAIR